MQPQQPQHNMPPQDQRQPGRPLSPMQSPHVIATQQVAHDEDADYAAASYSAAHYAEQIRAKRPTSKHNWRWLLIVIIVLALAGGTYWFLNRPKADKPVTTTSSQSATQKQTTSSSTIESTVKTFSSTQFTGLSFEYPANWKVTESSGVLTAVSPALSLKDATGQTKSIAVVYKIRNKQQTLPEFDKGSALAAIESQKIAYAKPSGTQRAQTYISFLQYASSATPGLDGIYVTGDAGYQAQQVIPKADFNSIDPVISMTFVVCSSGSESCSALGTPVSLAVSDWGVSSFAGPLKKMLESLIVL